MPRSRRLRKAMLLPPTKPPAGASLASPPGRDPPALRVLTDGALLQLVGSFVPSVEVELGEFERQVRAAFADPRALDGLAAPFERDGLLAQAAMQLGDREKLDLLIHANSCRRHGNKPRTWTLERALLGGVRSGRLDLLDHFLARLPAHRVSPDLLRVAAEQGSYRTMTWVYEHVPRQMLRVEARVVDDLARDGKLEPIRWLHDHGFTAGVSSRTFELASGSGNLDLVRFLHAHHGDGWSTDAMDRAATNGHVDIVAFLHRYRREGCTSQAMDGAAKTGRLDVVQFLHANRREGCTAAALNYAATSGHLAVVKFLVEHRSEGCLFEARNCSLLRGYAEQAAYLSSQMEPQLTLCSVRMHVDKCGGQLRRRCQIQSKSLGKTAATASLDRSRLARLGGLKVLCGSD